MTQIRIVDPFPPRPREPGDCWRYADGDDDGRECWWIVLPRHPDVGTPGHPGEISWRTTDRASDPPHAMWDVVGSPEDPTSFSVTPSIDVLRFVRNPAYEDDPTQPRYVRDGSYWHGFITNGVLVG